MPKGLRYSSPVVSRLALELFGAKQNPLAHDLSGLELHSRTRGDGHIDIGLVRITSDTGTGESHLEHPEIPQLDTITFGQCIRDMVERLLDDIEDIALNETRFVADGNDEIAFGEVGHDKKRKKASVGVEFSLSGAREE